MRLESYDSNIYYTPAVLHFGIPNGDLILLLFKTMFEKKKYLEKVVLWKHMLPSTDVLDVKSIEEHHLWLATCARKPNVPGSSPAASYMQR